MPSFGRVLSYPAAAADYLGDMGLRIARGAGHVGRWAARHPLPALGSLAGLGYYGWIAPHRLERARNNINPSREFQV